MNGESSLHPVHPPPEHQSHLVIQGQVAERWDVLGPLHQDQQLLLHGLAHIRDGGYLLGSDVAVQNGSGRRDLDVQTDERVHQPGWLLSS